MISQIRIKQNKKKVSGFDTLYERNTKRCTQLLFGNLNKLAEQFNNTNNSNNNDIGLTISNCIVSFFVRIVCTLVVKDLDKAII